MGFFQCSGCGEKYSSSDPANLGVFFLIVRLSLKSIFLSSFSVSLSHPSDTLTQQVKVSIQ